MYDPRSAIRRATKSMDTFVKKHDRPAFAVSSATGALPCCVLLRSLTDGVLAPDDMAALRSSAAIKAHVRTDGAVYKGAFELQGDRDSVVLVWGDPSMTPVDAERLAAMERKELTRRYEAGKLGPFGHSQRPKDVA